MPKPFVEASYVVAWQYTPTHDQIIETLYQFGFEALEHPTYNSDHAPSDYHIFVPHIDSLQGPQFPTNTAGGGA